MHPRPGDARRSHRRFGRGPARARRRQQLRHRWGWFLYVLRRVGDGPARRRARRRFRRARRVGGPAGDYVAARGRKHPTSNPDFVVVYTFLAGLFDPNQRAHGEKLRAMAPIDRETALLLMRNLGANLMCQRMWEDQIQLIGQGYPTFVNATYDERGGLTGVAGARHAGVGGGRGRRR